ncbi:Hypothetical predicted protein [Pelobates cultripes]|uniref:Uncharacterized protein n=1 Tax=Pelobates cultripes TaxID=61616 RepID=A0AAD1TEM5_PELCU|nr:Hypothetical predicted protein [Pelobates cultripes]
MKEWGEMMGVEENELKRSGVETGIAGDRRGTTDTVLSEMMHSRLLPGLAEHSPTSHPGPNSIHESYKGYNQLDQLLERKRERRRLAYQEDFEASRGREFGIGYLLLHRKSANRELTACFQQYL